MHTPSNNQLCAFCGGEGEATTITHEERRGTHLYVFENVPAKICGECREMWIDEEVLEQIDQLIETGVPERQGETPIFDFPRAIAHAH